MKPLSAIVSRVLGTTTAALCLTLMPACSDNDDYADTPRPVTLYDVVELTSSNSSAATFTLWRPDATTPVTLTARNPSVDLSGLKAGESLLLGYTPSDGQAYTSGDITVTGFGTVNNGVLQKAAPDKLAGWDADPVYLMSLWRAGDKICMRVRLTYDNEPRYFALVGDETTAGDPYPTAYLYHRRRDDRPNFSRQYYAAFDVSALWNTPTCRGLHIRVCNSNIPAMSEFTVENPRFAE